MACRTPRAGSGHGSRAQRERRRGTGGRRRRRQTTRAAGRSAADGRRARRSAEPRPTAPFQRGARARATARGPWRATHPTAVRRCLQERFQACSRMIGPPRSGQRQTRCRTPERLGKYPPTRFRAPRPRPASLDPGVVRDADARLLETERIPTANAAPGGMRALMPCAVRASARPGDRGARRATRPGP
jgi:hypothetical protein